KESRLLLQALEVGVQKEIITTVELELCKRQQTKVLQDEHFLSAEAAADVVNALALVLREKKESETPQDAFCTNCGKELQKEWGVCPYCGTPAAKIQQNPPNAEIVKTEPIKAETPKAESLPEQAPCPAPDKQTSYVTLEIQPLLNQKKQPNRKLIIAGVILLVILVISMIIAIVDDITSAPATASSSSNQQSAQELYYGGMQALQQDNIAFAIQNFEKALNLDPNNNLVRDSLQQARNRQSAVQFFTKGQTYYFDRNYDNAIIQYNEAIKLDSNYALAYFRRGEAYRMKGQYDMSIKDFDNALDRDDRFDDVYASRAEAYMQLGQRDRAIQDLGKALNLAPYNSAITRRARLKEIRGY
ncbi:MAG: tetratricopeptide repeat protein, partial [Treponema sp.]|nr:tetratricopeptide repeat protein [Treponema sp.]